MCFSKAETRTSTSFENEGRTLSKILVEGRYEDIGLFGVGFYEEIGLFG